MKQCHQQNATHLLLINLGLGILLGIIWYGMLYDRFPLYFTHVNWIFKAGGDALQHQLGWEFFRHENWSFPLGKISDYGYPFGTSITFMDSIPLLAIPFKLLSPWFKPNFQYFGLWELLSVIGQMLVGLLLVQEFTRSYTLKILGASLLVLSPPMMFRAFYHNSLSAHWILLLAIWFILLEYRGRLWRGAWIVLFGVSIWIHVYFIPMLLPLWLIAIYFRYQRDRNVPPLIFETSGILIVILITGIALGLFELSFGSLTELGFGVFSWNLNGFFNPFSFSSAYIKEQATGPGGQYEGFSYLGGGILMVLPVVVYLFIEKDQFRSHFRFLLPFFATAIVYTLYALSNKAFFNAIPLWDFKLPGSVLELFNLFRTSGRFIWPVFYFIVLFVIFAVIRNLRYPAFVLLAMLIVQYNDLQPLYQAKRLSEPASYETPLQSEFWQAAAETNRHILMIPALKLREPLEPFAIYAARHRLTLNIGYFARSNEKAITDYGETVWEHLQANQADPQTIYIFTTTERAALARAELSDEMLVCEVDGFTVLFSPVNELTKTTAGLPENCSFP